MSKEKLYAVKNDEGQYWDFEFGKFRPVDRVYRPADFDKEHAKAKARDYGGNVVTFVEEPKAELLTKEEDNALADPTNNSLASAISKYVHEQCNKCESVGPDILELKLMRALVNGYTVAKEKKYNVKVPYAVNSYFKKIDANYCTAGDTFYVDLDEDLAQFTESEINHYGLQDCEKEEVTDDGMGC